MPDIFLYAGQANPNDIRLCDPTALCGSSGTAWSVFPNDSITLSDSAVKSVGKTQSDTVTLSDGMAKGVAKPQTDTITLSDSTVKGAGKGQSDSISLSDSLAKLFGLNKSDTITLSDLISVPGSATAYSILLSDSIALSDSSARSSVIGALVFPAQFSGLRIWYNNSVHDLCLVAEADAPPDTGGVIKVRKNGVNYAVYLVDVTDENASNLRVQTGNGTWAVRLKT